MGNGRRYGILPARMDAVPAVTDRCVCTLLDYFHPVAGREVLYTYTFAIYASSFDFSFERALPVRKPRASEGHSTRPTNERTDLAGTTKKARVREDLEEEVPVVRKPRGTQYASTRTTHALTAQRRPLAVTRTSQNNPEGPSIHRQFRCVSLHTVCVCVIAHADER